MKPARSKFPGPDRGALTRLRQPEPRTARGARWLLLATILALCTAAADRQAAGQESEPSSVAEPAPASPTEQDKSPVGRLEPDTFLLPGDDDQLRKLLGFTYEDFVRAYKILHGIGQADQRPRYSIQNLVLSGKASGAQAQLHVMLTVRVQTDRPIGIPLGLESVLPTGVMEHDGQGENFLHFHDASRGYVLWVDEKADREVTFQFDVLVPLIQRNDETLLRLVLPRATTDRLTLVVETPAAQARCSESARLLPARPVGEGTELTAIGLGGELELSWRSSAEILAQTPPVLEAVGHILTRVDGQIASSVARLSVRSFGGPLQQFQVRLPVGAQLVERHASHYAVSPSLGDPLQRSGDDMGQLVDVRLTRKTNEPVQIELEVNHAHVRPFGDRMLQLAGFHVVGAARQFGYLAVQALGNWQVQCIRQEGLRRVEQLPESLREEDVVAGFEYDRQPYSLLARVAPRKAVVQIEPDVVLKIGARRVQLDAKLKYTVHGDKIFALQFMLPGWQVDWNSLGPAGIVDLDNALSGDEGLVSLPLRQPSSGQIELELKAHRQMAGGGRPVTFALPQPRDGTLLPGTVTVVPDDNVRVTPDGEESVGLSTQPRPPIEPFSGTQQAPLHYRWDGQQGIFAASVQVLPQSVTVDIESRVELAEKGGRVQQSMVYQVDYEPLDTVTLLVPTSINLERDFAVRVDGENVTPVELGRHGGNGSRQIQIALPRPALGKLVLEIDYALAGAYYTENRKVPLTVGLVMPVNTPLSGNRVMVTASPGLQVSHSTGHWRLADRIVAEDRRTGELQLESSTASTRLPLEILLADQTLRQATRVQRAWIQTWIAGDIRQDRAVYRLTTALPTIDMQLPSGVDPGDVQVLVDGASQTPEPLEDQRIRLQLAADGGKASSPRAHRLTLQYRLQHASASLLPVELEPPRLDKNIWIQRAYWQLVLPADLHIASDPDGFSSENGWLWRGLYWGRHPLLSQSDLETWSGSTPGPSAPRAANQYLFGSFGTIHPLRFRIAHRSLIVLASSGGVLVAGLLLLYTPTLRRAGSLFTMAMALLALGLVFPHVTMQVAQAATLGIVLVSLAVSIRLFLARHQPAGVVVRSGASSVSQSFTRQDSLFSAPDLRPNSTASTKTAVATQSSPSVHDDT